MIKEIEKIFNLLNEDLYLTAPVLSGNTRSSIRTEIISESEVKIIIEPKFYDLQDWLKRGKPWKRVDGKLVGDINFKESSDKFKKKYPNIESYAMWCNKLGAFGRANRSKHWCNRCVYEVCQAVANEINAEVINRLPL